MHGSSSNEQLATRTYLSCICKPDRQNFECPNYLAFVRRQLPNMASRAWDIREWRGMWHMNHCPAILHHLHVYLEKANCPRSICILYKFIRYLGFDDFCSSILYSRCQRFGFSLRKSQGRVSLHKLSCTCQNDVCSNFRQHIRQSRKIIRNCFCIAPSCQLFNIAGSDYETFDQDPMETLQNSIAGVEAEKFLRACSHLWKKRQNCGSSVASNDWHRYIWWFNSKDLCYESVCPHDI